MEGRIGHGVCTVQCRKQKVQSMAKQANTNGHSMIRITVTGRDPERVSLAVEGSIAGEDAGLLDDECTALLDAGQSVELDCSGVTYVDFRAVVILRRLRGRKLTVTGCSPVILEFLDQAYEY